MLDVLGLVPARGGSKGIPRKNIRLLGGKPLIAYTLEAARVARRLGRVVLSTDDDEIAEVGRRYGAEVPFRRPAEYAGDAASSMSAVLHALAWLREAERYEPDAVAVLAPTVPLRTAEHIDACVELLETTGFDTAVTVSEAADHPYFIYSLDGDGRMRELMPLANKPQRRQDVPPYYAASQGVIVVRRAYLDRAREDTPLVNAASAAGLVIDRQCAWDIDTPADWVMAEQWLLMRRAHAEGAVAPGARP